MANVYYGKMRMKEKEINSYAQRLQDTKNRCDGQALAALRMTEKYKNQIKNMEE